MSTPVILFRQDGDLWVAVFFRKAIPSGLYRRITLDEPRRGKSKVLFVRRRQLKDVKTATLQLLHRVNHRQYERPKWMQYHFDPVLFGIRIEGKTR